MLFICQYFNLLVFQMHLRSCVAYLEMLDKNVGLNMQSVQYFLQICHIVPLILSWKYLVCAIIEFALSIL